MAEHSVVHSTDPAVALATCASFLDARPVEHNVLLSLLTERCAHPEPGDYWWHEDGGCVDAFLFRSPPTFTGALAARDPAAAARLADVVTLDAPDLAGVTGEAGIAAAFAGQWTEALGTAASVHEGQRIYRLTTLEPPIGIPGALRSAAPAEVDTLVAWMDAFTRDTGMTMPVDRERLLRRIREGLIAMWEVDGRPVSTALATRPVVGASRIGMVYTPPEQRQRGYAGACVAALCARALADGARECLLYTQLANPTSNRVYRRIGFTAVAEVLAYHFG